MIFGCASLGGTKAGERFRWLLLFLLALFLCGAVENDTACCPIPFRVPGFVVGAWRRDYILETCMANLRASCF
jgi:hypothetical protein